MIIIFFCGGNFILYNFIDFFTITGYNLIKKQIILNIFIYITRRFYMDIMDVANLSMNLSSSRVINDVQVAVLKKSLDTLETTGDDLTKMMEASVTPNLGQNIDISI